MEFDYAEELLCDPNNIEIEIKRRQPEGSATRANQPNTSNELSSSFVNVPQGSPGVKAQFSSGNEITEQQNQRGMDSVSNDMDIGPVRSLSNEGQQYTPDFLSALRLEAPVYSGRSCHMVRRSQRSIRAKSHRLFSKRLRIGTRVNILLLTKRSCHLVRRLRMISRNALRLQNRFLK